MHWQLLQEFYVLVDARRGSANLADFELRGNSWCVAGFTNEDPTIDIAEAGSGELSIRCMIFFLKEFPRIASLLLASQRRKSDVDFKYYPFALVGLKLTTLLAIIYEFYDAPRPASEANFSSRSFWPLIAQKNGFYRLFVCVLLLFDMTWESIRDRYSLRGIGGRRGCELTKRYGSADIIMMTAIMDLRPLIESELMKYTDVSQFERSIQSQYMTWIENRQQCADAAHRVTMITESSSTILSSSASLLSDAADDDVDEHGY